MMMPQPQIINQDDSDLLERMRFQDLDESKIEVRTKCSHCSGRGSKNGDVCPVCEGDRKVIQSVSLLKLAKLLMPFIQDGIKKFLDEQE